MTERDYLIRIARRLGVLVLIAQGCDASIATRSETAVDPRTTLDGSYLLSELRSSRGAMLPLRDSMALAPDGSAYRRLSGDVFTGTYHGRYSVSGDTVNFRLWVLSRAVETTGPDQQFTALIQREGDEVRRLVLTGITPPYVLYRLTP